MELTYEQIEQLKACTTVEELKAFIKTLGKEITDQQAMIALERLANETEGKIGDDALAEVDGGSLRRSAAWIALTIVGIGLTCLIPDDQWPVLN